MVITVSTFALCLLVLLPLTEIFPSKLLRKSVSVILSEKSLRFKQEVNIIQKIDPVLKVMIYVFQVDGYAPRWKVYRDNIRLAGWEHRIKVEQFIGLKFLAALSLLIYFGALNLKEASIEMALLGIAMGMICFFLPDQWLNIKLKRRRWQIQKEIPSVLISLAVTTDAGLSLLQALEETCRRKNGAFTEELRKTVQEIAVGIPQKEAFENMANRIMIEELTLFVSALVQTLEKGASGLTQVLRQQADDAWKKRKSKAKELGEKASIKLFLPLIGLILPALMIFLITPAIFSILKFFVN